MSAELTIRARFDATVLQLVLRHGVYVSLQSPTCCGPDLSGDERLGYALSHLHTYNLQGPLDWQDGQLVTTHNYCVSERPLDPPEPVANLDFSFNNATFNKSLYLQQACDFVNELEAHGFTTDWDGKSCFICVTL